MGKLYIIATPIGNLEDITFRAVNLLKKVDIIACEDTRKTGLLLQRLNIKRKAKLLSYYEENEFERIPKIINFLKEGKNVALVSNAGTPAISDPGFKLIRQCLEQKIEIFSIPGPSAILASLVVSGLPTDKFLFLGYLPKKENKRIKLLKKCKELPFSCTLIIFESPYRVIRLLKDIFRVLGNLEIVIANELTKKFEKFYRGKIKEIVKVLEKKSLRGEFTILYHFSTSLKTQSGTGLVDSSTINS